MSITAPIILRNIRRVHHLQRVVLRNLDIESINTPSNCFYTLALPRSAEGSDFDSSDVFYVSEVALETLNPQWDEIRPAQFLKAVPQLSKRLVFAVYRNVSASTKELRREMLELAEQMRLHEEREATKAGRGPSVLARMLSASQELMRVSVDFESLEWIYPPQEREMLPPLPPNTLLFYFSDGLYVLPDHLESQVRHALSLMSVKPSSPANANAEGVPAPAAVASPTEATPSDMLGVIRSMIRNPGPIVDRRRLASPHQAISLQEFTANVNRVVELQLQVQSLEKESAALTARLNEALSPEKLAARTAGVKSVRIRQLEALVAEEQKFLAAERARIQTARKTRVGQAEALRNQVKLLQNEAQHVRYVLAAQTLQNTKSMCAQLKEKMTARRRKMIAQLEQIYPLTAKALPDASENAKFYMINQLRVPVTITTAWGDEENISTALGYVAHLVFLLAKYLEVPLRYRIVCRGSRSAICDDVQSFQEYPLYFRGVDEGRFLIGCNFLNKNIQQLLSVRTRKPPPSTGYSLANLDQLLEFEVPR